MRKHRVARWANRRPGGRRKPVYPIEPSVTTGGRGTVRLVWREVKRYRTIVVPLPKEVRVKGGRKTDHCPYPVEGRVVASMDVPEHEFWAKTVSLVDFVPTHLPRPEMRRP